MIELTSIGGAITSARALWEIVKNANDAQLAMKISSELANLQGQLLDVQQQALALQRENEELRTEIKKIKQEAEESNGLQFQHGVYRRTRDVSTTETDEDRRH
jgi:peptidoglycan hydrolase CwlO-like protein